MRNEQPASKVTHALVSCAAALCVTCTAHGEETVELSIPPQSLETALLAFSDQSGTQVVTSSDTVAHIKTKGVSGKLPPRIALARLLEGTDLRIHSEGAHSFSLARAQPRTPDAAANQRIETIIVTAQKREERLMEVPQSVTALSPDELAMAGAVQFRDYADTVPGLSYNTAGPGFTQVTLRGVTVGYDQNTTVATYVDEVPYGGGSNQSNAARMSLDAGLIDLERIEVLRGPQGTLYGASAIGGLIKYVSKRPSSEAFGGQAQLGVTSTEHGGLSSNIAGGVNLPISEGKAAARMSGFYTHDGGFIDDLAHGKDSVNQANIYGGRGDLLLTPTERFSARFAVYAQNISRDGEGSSDFTQAGSPAEGDLTQRRAIAEPFDQQFRLVSATLDYNFGGAKLTSISAYQQIFNEVTNDIPLYVPLFNRIYRTTFGGVGFHYIFDTDKFNQEIRLTSAADQKLEWVVGGIYQRDDIHAESGYVALDAAGLPDPANYLTNNFPGYWWEYAGYGTLTWHLTDKFDVSGGIRYAESEYYYSRHKTGLQAGSGQAPSLEGRANATTYLANARYLFNDQSMIYARYATGYRPGGPNADYIAVSTGLLTPQEPYNPDNLISYEAGFRYETAEHGFSMDLSAYFIDWKDIIIGFFDAATGKSGNTNAAGAHILGSELALTARPVSSLMLAATMTYTDAYLTAASEDLGAAEGERLPGSARFSGRLSADYEFSSVHWQPMFGAAVRYVGDRKASFDQSTGYPQYLLPDYTTVDLRAGLSFAPYEVQLYVHNLLDERGQLSALTWQGNPRVAMLQPRTIGLTVTTRF